MPTLPDTLRAKTDAELHFFIDNPGYYHPGLVAAARQELHRRGSGAAPQPATSRQAATYDEEAPATRRPLLLAAGVLGLVAVAGALFWPRQPAAVPTHKPAPTLETVASYALPSFDIDKLIETQLARIPAAEKQTPQTLRQFRGLTRRFWTAETQTEYLTTQAYAGQASPFFTEQARLTRETWRDWNKAAVYSYQLGPTMQAQYERMGQVASSQQHILAKLPDMLANRSFLTDREMQARAADVQDWLAGLRPVSPVTGKPYHATVVEVKL